MTNETNVDEPVDVKDEAVTDADRAALFPKSGVNTATTEEGDMPSWASEAIPAALLLPKDGQTVFVMKLEARLTARKNKGDRTIVIWELSLRDERQARARAQLVGENGGLYDEYAKGMIRSVDGVVVDWANIGRMDQFWDEIGPRFRGYLVGWYAKSHNLNDEERLRFFGQSVVSRTAG